MRRTGYDGATFLIFRGMGKSEFDCFFFIIYYYKGIDQCIACPECTSGGSAARLFTLIKMFHIRHVKSELYIHSSYDEYFTSTSNLSTILYFKSNCVLIVSRSLVHVAYDAQYKTLFTPI